MKKIIFIAAITAMAFMQKGFSQDSSSYQLLQSYLSIKNALVADNAIEASTQASGFVKTLNNIELKRVPEAARIALLKDANRILSSKDIAQQRKDFAKFSDDMIFFVKANMFDQQPVYVQYCPMKNAYWLSNETAIKNPYYGRMMLTCGSVKDTIK